MPLLNNNVPNEKTSFLSSYYNHLEFVVTFDELDFFILFL